MSSAQSARFAGPPKHPHLYQTIYMSLTHELQSRAAGRSARGFTLLFAVLVGSLLFSVGLAVANLAIKELTLSAAGKESEKAFYAADTGIECALYWDRRVAGTFPDSETAPRRASITCNAAAIALTVANETPSAATTTFRIDISPSCADVVVGKTEAQGGPAGSTVIESRGRSECGAAENPARVERALRVRY